MKTFSPICLLQLTLLQIIFVRHNILRLVFSSDGVRVGVESEVVSAYDPAGENQIMEGQARRNRSRKNKNVSTFLQLRLFIP